MRIKTSKRGLTFSFQENETFKAGKHYRYFIDTKKNEIILLPDENGKYIFSKKGKNKKPLVDLRNKEIRETISMAQFIEIEILENRILVHVIKKEIQFELNNDRDIVSYFDDNDTDTFEISKEDLLTGDLNIYDELRSSGFFSSKQANDLKYVFDIASLFSGAGLLDLPFKNDDSFQIQFACDFDKAAVETYKKNIGNHILLKDIRSLDACEVPDVDVIIGGPCCQGFSNENRAKNTQDAKTKRKLIDEYIRIVKAKKPLIFVIENVRQFLTKESGIYLETVLSQLSDYEITYSIVKDQEVGGFTKRERMILIGSKVGKILIPSVELTSKKVVRDAFSKVNESWYHAKDITKASKETQRKMAFVRPGHNYKDIPEMAHLSRHSNVYRRLSMDEASVTITNWRKVNLMPPVGNRSLSVAEAAALMGLNDDFHFCGTLNDRQQQVGNGVTQAIASFVKNIVKNALYGFVNRKMKDHKNKCVFVPLP